MPQINKLIGSKAFFGKRVIFYLLSAPVFPWYKSPEEAERHPVISIEDRKSVDGKIINKWYDATAWKNLKGRERENQAYIYALGNEEVYPIYYLGGTHYQFREQWDDCDDEDYVGYVYEEDFEFDSNNHVCTRYSLWEQHRKVGQESFKWRVR